MAVNKVVDVGGNTLVDLTGDTVTAETLAEGVTAHNSAGVQITGTMQSGGGSAVKVFVAGAPNGYEISVSGSESQYTSSNGDKVYMTTGDGFTLDCQYDAGGYGRVWFSDGTSETWSGDTDRWSYHNFGEKTVVGGYLKQTGVD